jgi:outer membrane receptor protein involved in Fe transport
VNANPMVVKGFEVFYQQPFTFLPEPFDGLGALANFTYTAGSQSGSGTGFVTNPGTTGSVAYRSPIPGLSNYTYSATMYYEKDSYNVRLSYNWRSKSEAGQGNYYQANWRMWTQARGTLDGTVGYDILDNLEIRFDVTNLLNTNGDYQFLETAVPAGYVWNANYARFADPAHGDRSHIFYNYLHGRNFSISLRGHL